METTAWRADGRGPEHTLNLEEGMESKEQGLQDFGVQGESNMPRCKALGGYSMKIVTKPRSFNVSLCTDFHPRSHCLTISETPYSSLVGVDALAGLLLRSPLAMERPCNISRANS